MVQVTKTGSVKFRFQAPRGEKVFLVGDFNAWNEQAHPMRQRGPDSWELDLPLRGGKYRFLYRVGNRWFVDNEAPDVPNAWGSEYSVVSVPEYPASRESKTNLP
jgi:1,4-alpha-glucan branching enzyme